MSKRNVLIDIQRDAVSVALLNDGMLDEFYLEKNNESIITGNIYCGMVVNVLQGLQSAFVDIGLDKNGFLFVEEMLVDKRDICTDDLPHILDIQEGEKVLVQVTKEAKGSKGARLTTNITLPGKYVILLPNIDFIGVSNKIENQEVRDNLTKILEKNRPAGFGLVARTVAQDVKKNEILDEIKELQAKYNEILQRYNLCDKVDIVYNEGDLIYRTVRDMIDDNIDSIVCNDATIYNNLKQRFAENLQYEKKLSYYCNHLDIYDYYGIFSQIDNLISRKVMLSSGSYLVIDSTEALTVIDVNTGHYIGTSNREETVFKTNMEAAEEIAKQLKLRNIGGIIVVDFIDMMQDENKTTLVEYLQQLLKKDRTKARALEMTSLGLVEITRKKVRNEISTVFLDNCPYCGSEGKSYSVGYFSRKLKAYLRRLLGETDYSALKIYLNPHIIERLAQYESFSEDCYQLWSNKRMYLIADDTIDVNKFLVIGENKSILNLPNNAKLLY